MKEVKNVQLSKKNVTENILTENDNTQFFKSRLHELAFYFSMNKSEFDKFLGIKKIHIIDIEKCRSLRREYLAIFHPDKNKEIDIGLDFNKISSDVVSVFHRVSSGKL